jgi:hypothetical protein
MCDTVISVFFLDVGTFVSFVVLSVISVIIMGLNIQMWSGC